jgi:transcriptional regulator with XRE-family HTH domain
MNTYIDVIGMAKRLSVARAGASLTLGQTAKILGITVSGVHSWERADRIPVISRVIDIAAAYGVSHGHILGIDSTGSIDMKAIPRRIYLARIGSRLGGLSLRGAGPIVGVSSSTIATWEKGTRNPRISTINLIASGYDVSVDFLLGMVPYDE